MSARVPAAHGADVHEPRLAVRALPTRVQQPMMTSDASESSVAMEMDARTVRPAKATGRSPMHATAFAALAVVVSVN